MKEHASFNRCYRLLWSGTTEQWKPVPETARTAKKGGRGKAANTLTLAGVLPGVAMGLFVMSNLAAQPPPAPPTPATTQLPTGGKVVGGQATISQSALATAANMVVNQSSQRAIIDWSNFNLGTGATVQFVQPNAQSVILNRVLDTNPTQVFGRINANGQVFLTNPYGVYFAPTASVDVGGLVATTYSISNDDFMSGRYTFNRNGSTARVVNEGNLSASLGGYIALLAPEVQNSGVVVARAGTVAMAAGEQVSLTMADGKGLSGITTTASAIASLIDNKLAVQAPDGQIILSAVAVNKLQGGVIKNSGSLAATSLSNQGGKIVLEADEIDLAATASIDVSGRTRGGTVLMGGDWQGSGNLRQATTVRMAAGATINANATDNGDGGKVVLWSNVSDANSTTTVAGSIYANAGPNGGNGGQIETSGHYLNVDGIQVSTLAPKGAMGEWLLDPANINITSIYSEANFTNASGTLAPNSSSATSVISNVTLSNALNSTNITITTVNNGTAAASTGNITISNAISWSNATTLTLIANDSITGAGNISMTGGGSVVFNTGNASIDLLNVTYTGLISGNGSVTKAGLGAFAISSNNTYSGNTTVSAGVLYARTGSNSTATLDGSGNYTFASSALGTGVVKVQDGATLKMCSSVNMANYLELQGTGASGQSGALVLTGGNVYGKTMLKASGTVIGFAGLAGYEGRFYGDILDDGSGLGLTLNSTAGSTSLFGTKSYTGTTFVKGNAYLYTTDAATNATFNTTFNISSGGQVILNTAMNAGVGITVTGDISGAGNLTLPFYSSTTQPTLNLQGKLLLTGTTNVTNATLVLSNSRDYTIASNFTGNSAGKLTVAGTGNLTLTGNSTGFTGKLNINTGSNVTLGDGVTSGIVSAASIANNGTLNFNRSDNVTVSSVISGSGTLNKLGSNVLTLSGANTFTGNITIQQGTLKAITSSTALGNNVGVAISDVAGAGLEIGVSGITLGSLSGGASASVNVSTNNLTVGTNNATTTYSGTLVGSGSLIKTGTGTLTLPGNHSTFTGTFNVSDGTEVFTNTSVLGNGANLLNITGNNATLELQNISSLSNPINLSSNGTLLLSSGNTTLSGNLSLAMSVSPKVNVSANRTVTITGNVASFSNSSLLTISGPGTLLLSETGTTSSQTIKAFNVTAGMFELNSSKLAFTSVGKYNVGANGVLKFDYFNAATFSSSAFDFVNNGVIQFAPSSTTNNDFWGNITGTGSVDIFGSAITRFSRQGTYTGGTTVRQNSSATMSSSNNGFGNSSSALTNYGTLYLYTGGSTDWGQSIAGTGNVMIDSGDTNVRTFSMGVTNTYTGTTTIGPNARVYLGGANSTSPNATGTLGTGDIILNGPNATLSIRRSSNMTIASNISGTGKIEISNVNQTDTFTGNVNITGGVFFNAANTTLKIASTGSLGSNGTFSSPIQFNSSNATFEYAGVTDVTMTGNITNYLSGPVGTSLRKTTSSSVLTLTGFNNITGNVYVEAGTLYVSGSSNQNGMLGSGTIYDNATLVFNHTDTTLLNLSSLAGNITGTGDATFISVGNISIDKTINLSGSNSLIKIQSNSNVTVNSNLTSSGSNGKIILIAGAATAAGTATGGQIAINTSANLDLSSSGSVVMFQGNNSANLTATLDARVVSTGANTTSVPKYKTYNASLGNVSSAVTGTRNYFYRVQPTATINGGTVTATKVYDGTVIAYPNYTGGGSVTGVDGDTLTGCVTGASYNTSSAGNKSLTYNVALASNNSAWVVSGYAGTVNPTSTVANITQAPLVIQANDAADFVTLSAASGSFAGVSYSGFVHGENATTAGLTGTLNISRAAGNSAGTYALTPSGLSASNYAISYRTGTYTIVPAQKLIIRVNDGTSVYGDASNFNVSSVSYLMPDNVTITNLTPSLTFSNGVYSVNDGVGGTASFKLGLSNATLSASNNAGVGMWNVAYNNLSTGGVNFNGVTVAGTQTITKRDLNITVAADNKVYDGNTNASFNLTTNRVAGDALTISTDALGVFASRNVANGIAVTLGNITIAGADVGNYNLLSNTVSTAANITPKSLTMSGLTVSNKVYDATTSAFVSSFGSLSGVVGFDDVQLNTSAMLSVFSDKNAANNKNVTVSGVLLNGLDANNYKVNNATTTANITPKALTVSGLSVASSKVYDGTNVAAPLGTAILQAASAAGAGNSADGKPYSGDGISITGTPVGTYNSKDVATAANVSITGLSLNGNTNGNYVLSAPEPLAATITPASLTIKANDDANFVTLAASAGAFAGVSYNGFVQNENATTAGFTGTLAISRPAGSTAGTYTLTPSGLSASNYGITYQTGNFTIVPAQQLLIRVSDSTSVYGSSTNLNVANVSYLMADNVTVVNLTPSLTSSGGVYSVNDGAGGSASFKLGLSNVTLSGSNTAAVGSWNAAYNNLSIVGNNFNAALAVGTQTVTRKALTATATGANKMYDGTTNVTVTLASSDAIANDNVSYAYTNAYFSDKNVGTTKSVLVSNISLNGTDAGNYIIQSTVASASANISAKTLTITGITAADKVYDGTNTSTVNVSGVNSTSLVGMGMIAGDSLSVAATGVFSNKNAGTNKTVTLTSNYSGADVGNYNIVSQANASASIAQKALTITGITSDNKVYDGTTTAVVNTSAITNVTLVTGGMIAGDSVTVTATGVFADKNVDTNKTVTLASNYSGADAGNYNITSQANTRANITQKALTITGITATDKVYDGSTNAMINASSISNTALVGMGVVAGDNLTLSATGVFADKNVGTNRTVTLTSNYSGADLGNYNITSQANTRASITHKALTITGITATDKVYDGTTNATINASSINNTALVGMGMVAGDSLTVATTGVFADKNAGANKTVTLTSNYSGADLGNYLITSQANTRANIRQKALTITGITAADKVYDGTTTAVVNTSGVNNVSLAGMGLIAGDRLTVLATGEFADMNVGAGKTVNLHSSYGGADVDNYLITSQASTTANISGQTNTPANNAGGTSNGTKVASSDGAVLASLIVPPIVMPAPAPVITARPIVAPSVETLLSTVAPTTTTAPAASPAQAAINPFELLSPPQLRALANEQVRAMTTLDIATLTPVQAQAFTLEQLALMSSEQKLAFTPTQRALMSVRQISAISDDAMTSEKALAMVTQNRGVNATPASTTERVEQAAPAATATAAAAATPAPATAVASVSNSAPSQSGTGAAPNVQDAIAPKSGVLPVSVLGDSRMTNMGMAYEEQPNDVRIQMTTSPDAARFSPTTIRFTGNFKTFMVNNDRGEMVAYQGAMVGKRIVILAETEASKNLARQEMQTVLAAAITTLGSTGSISLAQLEGVVLDLR